MEVLQLSPYAPEDIQTELERKFTVHRLWDFEDDLPPSDIAGRIIAVATKGDLGLGPDLMRALRNLKLIAVYGVGYDAIDLDEANRRGIAVTTTPGLLTDAVAELAIALVLSASRRIVEGDHRVRNGKWVSDGALELAQGLTGRTIGIFGYGRIGRRVSDIAKSAFRARVLYCDLGPISGEEEEFRPDALSLAKDCDVFVIASAGGDGTRGIVNRDVMRAIGSDGLLVNVARGSVVNEDDLIAALELGELGGAALDVFDDEPNVPQPLLAMKNAILTPHIASGTFATRRAMGRSVIDNLAAFRGSRPLLTELKLQ